MKNDKIIDMIKNSIQLSEKDKEKLINKYIKSNYNDKIFICPICGNLVKFSNGHLHKSCGNEKCYSILKASMTGKKRPEFAKKISNLMKEKHLNGTLRTEEHNNKLSSKLNTVEWKKSGLKKYGMINEDDTYSDDEINILYQKMKVEKTSTFESKVRRILKLSKIYINEKEYLESRLYGLKESDLTKENIDSYIKTYNSLKSVIAMRKNPNMGACNMFKRILKTNFDYNDANQNEICVKSTYESNYIDYFETYGINWSYETVYIKNNDTYYVIDFLINKKELLEVKGCFYRTNPKKYFYEKIKNAIIYARENGMRYLFSFSAYFSKDKIYDFTDMSDEKIIEILEKKE